MCIHLLTVPGLGLEVRREGLAVHESITVHDADGSTLGKDAQKRCLFFKRDQFGSVSLMNKEGLTFPAPDSPISAVNFLGTT